MRQSYVIYRDVYKQDKSGIWSVKVARQLLNVTNKRYKWSAYCGTMLNWQDSRRILDNLQRVVRPQYNYGKLAFNHIRE